MKKGIFLLLLIVALHYTVNGQTKEEVLRYCDSIGIKHANIVVSQSVLETGNYQCTKCSLDQNNIFGFIYKGQYLKFDNWQKSCDYYLRWQTKHYEDQDYYSFLNCLWKHKDGRCARYATDLKYTDKLKELK